MKTLVLSILTIATTISVNAQPKISAKSEKFEWELARNPKATTSKYSYPTKVLLRDKSDTYIYFREGRRTEVNWNPQLFYSDMKQPLNKAYDGTEKNTLDLTEAYSILKVNNNTGKALTKEIPNPRKLKPKTTFERMNILSFNNKLYLIGNLIFQEKAMSSDIGMKIAMIEIDKETFECKTDELIVLASFEYWKYMDMKCLQQMPYGFKISEDGKKLGIVIFDPIRKGEECKVRYKVFDENLNVVSEFSRSEKLEEHKGVYRMYEYGVSNDGTIVEFGNLVSEFEYMSDFDWWKMNKKDFEGCSSLIRAYPVEEPSSSITHVSERLVGDGTIKQLPSGKLGIIRTSINNYYSIATYNPENKRIEESFNEISSSDMYVSKKAQKKSNFDDDYSFRGVDLLEDSQGNIYVMYDQSRAQHTRYNIIASKFDRKLDLSWQKSIPRVFIPDNRQFIFAHHESVPCLINDELVIMYNDNPENSAINPLTGDNVAWLEGKSNGICMAATFNDIGDYTRNPLLELGDGMSLESWLISTIWHSGKDDNVIFINDYDGIRMLKLD